MPNIKSAKKRVKTILVKKEINNLFKSKMKNSIKAIDKACKAKDKETATASLNTTIKNIDRALNKGIIKKNAAARYKSRITKNVNSME